MVIFYIHPIKNDKKFFLFNFFNSPCGWTIVITLLLIIRTRNSFIKKKKKKKKKIFKKKKKKKKAKLLPSFDKK